MICLDNLSHQRPRVFFCLAFPPALIRDAFEVLLLLNISQGYTLSVKANRREQLWGRSAPIHMRDHCPHPSNHLRLWIYRGLG
jgi:hypothetical protein